MLCCAFQLGNIYANLKYGLCTFRGLVDQYYLSSSLNIVSLKKLNLQSLGRKERGENFQGQTGKVFELAESHHGIFKKYSEFRATHFGNRLFRLRCVPLTAGSREGTAQRSLRLFAARQGIECHCHAFKLESWKRRGRECPRRAINYRLKPLDRQNRA